MSKPDSIDSLRNNERDFVETKNYNNKKPLPQQNIITPTSYCNQTNFDKVNSRSVFSDVTEELKRIAFKGDNTTDIAVNTTNFDQNPIVNAAHEVVNSLVKVLEVRPETVPISATKNRQQLSSSKTDDTVTYGHDASNFDFDEPYIDTFMKKLQARIDEESVYLFNHDMDINNDNTMTDEHIDTPIASTISDLGMNNKISVKSDDCSRTECFDDIRINSNMLATPKFLDLSTSQRGILELGEIGIYSIPQNYCKVTKPTEIEVKVARRIPINPINYEYVPPGNNSYDEECSKYLTFSHDDDREIMKEEIKLPITSSKQIDSCKGIEESKLSITLSEHIDNSKDIEENKLSIASLLHSESSNDDEIESDATELKGKFSTSAVFKYENSPSIEKMGRPSWEIVREIQRENLADKSQLIAIEKHLDNYPDHARLMNQFIIKFHEEKYLKQQESLDKSSQPESLPKPTPCIEKTSNTYAGHLLDEDKNSSDELSKFESLPFQNDKPIENINQVIPQILDKNLPNIRINNSSIKIVENESDTCNSMNSLDTSKLEKFGSYIPVETDIDIKRHSPKYSESVVHCHETEQNTMATQSFSSQDYLKSSSLTRKIFDRVHESTIPSESSIVYKSIQKFSEPSSKESGGYKIPCIENFELSEESAILSSLDNFLRKLMPSIETSDSVQSTNSSKNEEFYDGEENEEKELRCKEIPTACVLENPLPERLIAQSSLINVKGYDEDQFLFNAKPVIDLPIKNVKNENDSNVSPSNLFSDIKSSYVSEDLQHWPNADAISPCERKNVHLLENDKQNSYMDSRNLLPRPPIDKSEEISCIRVEREQHSSQYLAKSKEVNQSPLELTTTFGTTIMRNPIYQEVQQEVEIFSESILPRTLDVRNEDLFQSDSRHQRDIFEKPQQIDLKQSDEFSSEICEKSQNLNIKLTLPSNIKLHHEKPDQFEIDSQSNLEITADKNDMDEYVFSEFGENILNPAQFPDKFDTISSPSTQLHYTQTHLPINPKFVTAASRKSETSDNCLVVGKERSPISSSTSDKVDGFRDDADIEVNNKDTCLCETSGEKSSAFAYSFSIEPLESIPKLILILNEMDNSRMKTEESYTKPLPSESRKNIKSRRKLIDGCQIRSRKNCVNSLLKRSAIMPLDEVKQVQDLEEVENEIFFSSTAYQWTKNAASEKYKKTISSSQNSQVNMYDTHMADELQNEPDTYGSCKIINMIQKKVINSDKNINTGDCLDEFNNYTIHTTASNDSLHQIQDTPSMSDDKISEFNEESVYETNQLPVSDDCKTQLLESVPRGELGACEDSSSSNSIISTKYVGSESSLRGDETNHDSDDRKSEIFSERELCTAEQSFDFNSCLEANESENFENFCNQVVSQRRYLSTLKVVSCIFSSVFSLIHMEQGDETEYSAEFQKRIDREIRKLDYILPDILNWQSSEKSPSEKEDDTIYSDYIDDLTINENETDHNKSLSVKRSASVDSIPHSIKKVKFAPGTESPRIREEKRKLFRVKVLSEYSTKFLKSVKSNTSSKINSLLRQKFKSVDKKSDNKEDADNVHNNSNEVAEDKNISLSEEEGTHLSIEQNIRSHDSDIDSKTEGEDLENVDNVAKVDLHNFGDQGDEETTESTTEATSGNNKDIFRDSVMDDDLNYSRKKKILVINGIEIDEENETFV